MKMLIVILSCSWIIWEGVWQVVEISLQHHFISIPQIFSPLELRYMHAVQERG